MRTLLFTEALSFDGRELAVVDLVLAGLNDGSWQRLERESALSVGAESELEAAGAAPSTESVGEEARAFRYERRLLAREDLERWLSDRGLTREDWRGHLRRRLARGLAPDAAPGDATPVLRADALCSGTLERCARRLVAGAAAARALGLAEPEAGEAEVAALVRAAHETEASGLEAIGDDELGRRARLVAGLLRARTLLAEQAAEGDALERRIASHALDWLSFETEELVVGNEDVAREVRMCVQEDGATLPEVGAVAGAAAATRTRLFAETEPELRTRLVGARAGELVGPVPLGGAFVVARLLGKTPPSAGDASVSERARAELVAEAIDRHSAGRVVWHVAL